MTEIEWIDNFSKNLRYLMDRDYMTQDELAEATGISQGTISKYLSGRLKPGIKALINISYALNCNLNELIDFGPIE